MCNIIQIPVRYGCRRRPERGERAKKRENATKSSYFYRHFHEKSGNFFEFPLAFAVAGRYNLHIESCPKKFSSCLNNGINVLL